MEKTIDNGEWKIDN